MAASDKVWIVDDDRSIRWVLEKALMQEGLDATAFDDAQVLLKRDSNTLHTNIKAKQLSSTINLTQGTNY